MAAGLPGDSNRDVWRSDQALKPKGGQCSMLKTTILRLRFFVVVLSILSTSFPLLFILPETAGAADVTLAWDQNQEPTVAGYKVFNGPASRNYNGTVDVGNWTSCIMSGLEPGKTYYFAAKAYDTAGKESDFSGEIAYTVPASCSFSLSPASQSFAASGGSGSVAVTAPSGCSWSSSSSVAWITITAGSGSGNGALNFSVAPNSATSTRAGNINIGSQTFSVSQAATATALTYTIGASTGSNGSISPSGNVTVDAGTSKTFTITPKRYYQVSKVLIDGSSIGAVSTYKFSNITGNHTIRAEFKRKSFWSW
jgi:hypothetical protein